MSKIRISKLRWSVFVAFLIGASSLHGQDSAAWQVYGDSAVKADIAAWTREIYDSAGDWVFVLTRSNPLEVEDAFGTEIRGVFLDGAIGRVLATVWSEKGRYAAEYYVHEGGPLLVYETFAYFEDSASKEAWRNFKGYPAWERRSYFRGEAIAFAQARGETAPLAGRDAERLMATARRLIELLEKRRREREVTRS